MVTCSAGRLVPMFAAVGNSHALSPNGQLVWGRRRSLPKTLISLKPIFFTLTVPSPTAPAQDGHHSWR